MGVGGALGKTKRSELTGFIRVVRDTDKNVVEFNRHIRACAWSRSFSLLFGAPPVFCPIRRLSPIGPGFVEVHEALKAFLQTNLCRWRNFFLLVASSLIRGEQQRFSFGDFFLSEQTSTKKAAGAECQPIIWKFLFADAQALVSQRFGFGEFLLDQQSSG